MDAAEPRVRRRGFFLHSDTGETEAAEVENPEGLVVRSRTHASRHRGPGPGRGRFAGGRSRSDARAENEDRPEIRSGSVTGSRQRSHLPH